MPKSTTPRNNEIIITRAITTAVEPIVCLRDGQVTFLSSTLTSLKNWAVLVKILSLGLTTAVPAAADFFLRDTAGFFFSPLAADAPEAVFVSPRS